jgi:hypothetical protein
MVGGKELQQRRILANLLLLASFGCVALLCWFPPATTRFYPACPIHKYLGLLCPGCGGTHAIAALLHGQLREAVRLNGLVVMLLPFGLAFGARSYFRAVASGGYSWPRVPNAAVYACLLAAVVFTTVRNLSR